MRNKSSEIVISITTLYKYYNRTSDLRKFFIQAKRKIDKELKEEFVDYKTQEILKKTSDTFKKNIAILTKLENNILELTREI